MLLLLLLFYYLLARAADGFAGGVPKKFRCHSQILPDERPGSGQ